MPENRITIIGGGYSGVMTLVSLVDMLLAANQSGTNNTTKTIISLYERQNQFGGVAYGRQPGLEHIMNVSIKVMTPYINADKHDNKGPFCYQPAWIKLSLLEFLDAKDQQWFVNYGGESKPRAWRATDYCPRRYYGDYLSYIIEQAIAVIQTIPSIELIIRNNTEIEQVTHDENNQLFTIVSKPHQLNREQEQKPEQTQAEFVVVANGYTGFNFSPITLLDDIASNKPALVLNHLWNTPDYTGENGVIYDRLYPIMHGQPCEILNNQSAIVCIGSGLSAMDVLRTYYLIYTNSIKSGQDITPPKLVLLSRHGFTHVPTEKDSLEHITRFKGDFHAEDFTQYTNQQKYDLFNHIISWLRNILQHTKNDTVLYDLDTELKSLDIDRAVKLTALLYRLLADDQNFSKVVTEQYSDFMRDHEQDFRVLETTATGMPYANGQIIEALARTGLLEIKAIDNLDITRSSKPGERANTVVISYETKQPGQTERRMDYTQAVLLINTTGYHLDYTACNPTEPNNNPIQNLNTQLIQQRLLPKPNPIHKSIDLDDAISAQVKRERQLYAMGPIISGFTRFTEGKTYSIARSIFFLKNAIRRQCLAIVCALYPILDRRAMITSVASSQANTDSLQIFRRDAIFDAEFWHQTLTNPEQEISQLTAKTFYHQLAKQWAHSFILLDQKEQDKLYINDATVLSYFFTVLKQELIIQSSNNEQTRIYSEYISAEQSTLDYTVDSISHAQELRLSNVKIQAAAGTLQVHQAQRMNLDIGYTGAGETLLNALQTIDARITSEQNNQTNNQTLISILPGGIPMAMRKLLQACYLPNLTINLLLLNISIPITELFVMPELTSANTVSENIIKQFISAEPNNPLILLSGQSGVGKSTLIKHYLYAWCANEAMDKMQEKITLLFYMQASDLLSFHFDHYNTSSEPTLLLRCLNHCYQRLLPTDNLRRKFYYYLQLLLISAFIEHHPGQEAIIRIIVDGIDEISLHPDQAQVEKIKSTFKQLLTKNSSGLKVMLVSRDPTDKLLQEIISGYQFTDVTVQTISSSGNKDLYLSKIATYLNLHTGTQINSSQLANFIGQINFLNHVDNNITVNLELACSMYYLLAKTNPEINITGYQAHHYSIVNLYINTMVCMVQKLLEQQGTIALPQLLWQQSSTRGLIKYLRIIAIQSYYLANRDYIEAIRIYPNDTDASFLHKAIWLKLKANYYRLIDKMPANIGELAKLYHHYEATYRFLHCFIIADYLLEDFGIHHFTPEQSNYDNLLGRAALAEANNALELFYVLADCHLNQTFTESNTSYRVNINQVPAIEYIKPKLSTRAQQSLIIFTKIMQWFLTKIKAANKAPQSNNNNPIMLDTEFSATLVSELSSQINDITCLLALMVNIDKNDISQEFTAYITPQDQNNEATHPGQIKEKIDNFITEKVTSVMNNDNILTAILNQNKDKIIDWLKNKYGNSAENNNTVQQLFTQRYLLFGYIERLTNTVIKDLGLEPSPFPLPLPQKYIDEALEKHKAINTDCEIELSQNKQDGNQVMAIFNKTNYRIKTEIVEAFEHKRKHSLSNIHCLLENSEAFKTQLNHDREQLYSKLNIKHSKLNMNK